MVTARDLTNVHRAVRKFLAPGRARGSVACGLPLLLIFAFGLRAAKAQDDHKRKLPIVDKLSSGANRQAFSGKVATLDLKRHVLEVNATEGKTLEIFPIKNSTTVTSVGGDRIKLTQLKAGYDVIIYYDQKGDRRTVKNIVVLAAGTADKEKEKKSAPSS